MRFLSGCVLLALLAEGLVRENAARTTAHY